MSHISSIPYTSEGIAPFSESEKKSHTIVGLQKHVQAGVLALGLSIPGAQAGNAHANQLADFPIEQTPKALVGSCNANPIQMPELRVEDIFEDPEYFDLDKEQEAFFIRYTEFLQKITQFKQEWQAQGKVLCDTLLPNGKGISPKEQALVMKKTQEMFSKSMEIELPKIHIPKNIPVGEAKNIMITAIGEQNIAPKLAAEYTFQIKQAKNKAALQKISDSMYDAQKKEVERLAFEAFTESVKKSDDISKQLNAEHDTGLYLIKELFETYGNTWNPRQLSDATVRITYSVLGMDEGAYENWERNLNDMLTQDYGMNAYTIQQVKNKITAGKTPQTLEEKITFAMIQKGKILGTKKKYRHF